MNKQIEQESMAIKPFAKHIGIAVPMLANNIDTDQIIPSREMKKVSKRGLSEGLFAGQRYLSSNTEGSSQSRRVNPEFILNIAPFNQASILLGGNNFGCGSSREHAAWAISEFGFKVIIAPSFGNIFRTNCLRNGILPITLNADQIELLHGHVMADPATNRIAVDVTKLLIVSPNGEHFSFDLETHFQEMLIEGLDFISLTMKRQEEIDKFIKQDRSARPWAHLT